MKRILLALMLVLLSGFAIHAQDEESATYTFEDGSVLTFPEGWNVLSEADEFGNLEVTTSDGQFSLISLPALDQIAPALEQLEIDPDNVLEGLLEVLMADTSSTIEDGELENATYGDAEVLTFTVSRNERTLALVLGQYPTGHIMLFNLEFEGEADAAILDDIASIYENAEIVGEISTEEEDAVSDDAETDEEAPVPDTTSGNEDVTTYGFLDERVFAVPSDWEFGEKNEDASYFIFIILPVDENAMQVQARIDIPTEEMLAQALDEIGVDLEELPVTVIELLANDNAVDFDEEAVETVEFDRGTITIFRVLDDEGFFTTWYFATYDNDRIVLLNYIGYAEFGEALEQAALAIIDSVEFPE